MCMVLLLGSDIPIPTSHVSDTHPRLPVEELQHNEGATQYFSKAHVYYLASYEGCGCGFEFDEQQHVNELEEWTQEWKSLSVELKKEINWSPQDEFEKYQNRKQSCEELLKLVKQLLQHIDEVELYAVLHDPDHEKQPTLIKTITPDDIIINGRFSLFPQHDHERILYKIVTEK